MKRSLVWMLGLTSILLTALPAQAQFANRSLGVSAGYIDFDRSAGLDGGLFLGLEGSLYIENGFDLVSLSKISFPRDPITGRRVVGLAPSVGIRYLILEESIRPYVGTDLSYLFVFTDAVTMNFVGIGPNVGIDYFVTDTVSLGARAQYNIYVMLNEPTQNSLTLSLGVAAYF